MLRVASIRFNNVACAQVHFEPTRSSRLEEKVTSMVIVDHQTNERATLNAAVPRAARGKELSST